MTELPRATTAIDDIKQKLSQLCDDQANNTDETLCAHEVLPLLVSLVETLENDFLGAEEVPLSMNLVTSLQDFLYAIGFVLPSESGEESELSIQSRALLFALQSEVEDKPIEEIVLHWQKEMGNETPLPTPALVSPPVEGEVVNEQP